MPVVLDDVEATSGGSTSSDTMRQVLCVTLEIKAHTPDKGADVVPDKGADRRCLWQRAPDVISHISSGSI